MIGFIVNGNLFIHIFVTHLTHHINGSLAFVGGTTVGVGRDYIVETDATIVGQENHIGANDFIDKEFGFNTYMLFAWWINHLIQRETDLCDIHTVC